MEYLPDSQILRIFYVSGAIYDYLQVPQSVYLEMKKASSKGTFLNKVIKERFAFEKKKD